MLNFAKGIITGLGAVSPGLSGSVLLVIFGLYQKTITTISTLITDFFGNIKALTKRAVTFGEFWKNLWRDIWKGLRFLLPLALGMVLGVFLFSNLVKFLLDNYAMPTRYAFLGLVVGSLPLVFKEVRKEGFSPKYYALIGGAFLLGVWVFYINAWYIPPIRDPHFLQSVLLGVVVAASYVVPGIDSAVILSSLGMYVLWNNSLADLNVAVLIPAAIGLVLGVVAVSLTITKLMKVCYTGTFSVIFGFFLSIVPSVLREEETRAFYMPQAMDTQAIVSIIALVLGMLVSLAFGNIEKMKDRISKA